MTHIKIELPLAYSTANTLKRANNQLDSIRSSLSSQWSHLSANWDGADKYEIEARVRSALDGLNRMSGNVYALGVALEAQARLFEEVDERQKSPAAAVALSGISLAAVGAVLGASTTNPLWNATPEQVRDHYSNLSWEDKFRAKDDLSRRIAELEKELAALDQQIAARANAWKQEAADIDRQIADLKAKKLATENDAKNWMNQIWPTGWPREGEDGWPLWKTKADELEEQAEAYQRQIDALEQRLREGQAQLDALVAQRGHLQTELAQSQSRQATLNQVIESQLGSMGHPPTTVAKTNAGRPVDAPITGNSYRNPELYNQVLDQFSVERNARYAPRNGNTYCNIYVWDTTRAMGAEIPHHLDKQGNPIFLGKPGDPLPEGYHEMNANETVGWLGKHGNEYGWRTVTAQEAQALANQGKPVVGGWINPDGSKAGHMAMVRPGGPNIGSAGPQIAQAGGTNYSSTSADQGFGNVPLNRIVYYVHD